MELYNEYMERKVGLQLLKGKQVLEVGVVTGEKFWFSIR